MKCKNKCGIKRVWKVVWWRFRNFPSFCIRLVLPITNQNSILIHLLMSNYTNCNSAISKTLLLWIVRNSPLNNCVSLYYYKNFNYSFLITNLPENDEMHWILIPFSFGQILSIPFSKLRHISKLWQMMLNPCMTKTVAALILSRSSLILMRSSLILSRSS